MNDPRIPGQVRSLGLVPGRCVLDDGESGFGGPGEGEPLAVVGACGTPHEGATCVDGRLAGGLMSG